MLSPLKNLNHDSTVPNVIVCGLGSLGQQCVKVLSEFGVSVVAIELKKDFYWSVDGLPNSVKQKVICGDCRQPNILKRAGVTKCRVVLLMLSDEQINIETAFVIRKLNHDVRLIIRSAQENLNKSKSLKSRLNNFVAYDTVELPAQAIATRALNDENRGFFDLGEDLLRVVKITVNRRHQWYGRRLEQLNNNNRLVLGHRPFGTPIQKDFLLLENAKICEKDEVVYIEVNTGKAGLFIEEHQLFRKRGQVFFSLNWKKLWNNVLFYGKSFPQKLLGIWESGRQQIGLAVVQLALIIWLSLLVLGFILLNSFFYHKANHLGILYATVVMLLGGYNDVHDLLDKPDALTLQEKFWFDQPKYIWLRLMNLLFMAIGILTLGLLNAWLTQWLLNDKFQQLITNPIPKRDHIVVIGLGRQVGRRVANFLHKWQKPVVGIFDTALQSSSKHHELPQVQLVVGDLSNPSTAFSDLSNALEKVYLDKAKGVVVITRNEMLNLEVALMAYNLNPETALIIRTQDTSFSHCVRELVPKHAKTLSVCDIAAKVFVATVFVKKICGLLWLNDQMIFVCEYIIKRNDAFDGLSLDELTLKYQIRTIVHQKTMLPSTDIQMKVGNRLIFLASIESLQKIEQSQPLTADY